VHPVSEGFLLDRILEPGSLSVRWQPVLELRRGRVEPHYFEALIRGPQGTSAESPAILFEYARKKSQESRVDRACVEAILAEAQTLPGDWTLGINVHASTLAMDDGFVAFLAAGLEARSISAALAVVEVVEHAPPWNVLGFRRAIAGLRELGARVALDDVGLGHSNYMMMLECRPDYLKMDRHFVDGCHGDSYRRAVLSSVVQLARAFGARVVAEGVENVEDLTALRRLGITLVQGFLLARPAPAAELVAPSASRYGVTTKVRRGTAGAPGRR